MRVPCPTGGHTRQVSRKDVPVLVYRAKPYTALGFGWAACACAASLPVVSVYICKEDVNTS